MRFDDVAESSARKAAPNAASIEQAIDFGIAYDKPMVCCRAGQFRSAAIAFSIAFEKLGKERAIELLNPKRHSPNERVIRIAAGIIRRPGLLEVYDQWAYDNSNVRLVDYLDEIEREYDVLESNGARNGIGGL